MLSCDVIIWDDNTPLFVFPGNFTHSNLPAVVITSYCVQGGEAHNMVNRWNIVWQLAFICGNAQLCSPRFFHAHLLSGTAPPHPCWARDRLDNKTGNVYEWFLGLRFSWYGWPVSVDLEQLVQSMGIYSSRLIPPTRVLLTSRNGLFLALGALYFHDF